MNARKVLAPLGLALGLLAPSLAQAQVEVRCPTGWDSALILRSAQGYRPVRECRQGTQSLTVMQYGAPVRADQEQERAAEMLAMSNMPAPEGGLTFRDETIGGRRLRLAELSLQGQTRGGQVAQVSLAVGLLPVGENTVLVKVSSISVQGSDAAAPSASAVATLRTLVPTIAGLDGSTPNWRASATCPAGVSPQPTEGATPNGTRAVTSCGGQEEATQLLVFESRLAVRTPAEARAVAMEHFNLFTTQLAQLRPQIEVAEPQVLTVGALRGFTVSLRMTVSDPRVPAGSSGGAQQLSALVAVLPTTTGGNVQVLTLGRSGDVNALLTQVRSFVTSNLRLDGSGVPSSAPAATDGGATAPAASPVDAGASAAPAPEAPRRRRHDFDPSIPLWQPPPEDLALRRDAGARDGGGAATSGGPCNCSTPGAPRHAPSSALGVVGLAALALCARRR